MYPQVRQLDTIRREALAAQKADTPVRLPRLSLRSWSLKPQPAPCRGC